MSSSSSFYIKRSCLPKRRSGRCHSRSTTVPRPSRDCHVDPSSTCEYIYSAEARVRARRPSDWPILDFHASTATEINARGRWNGPVGVDGEGETNGEAARAKSRRRLARFRVYDPSDNRPAPSAPYRTPAPPPYHGHRTPAVILHRALIRASLRIATAARAVLPNDNKF